MWWRVFGTANRRPGTAAETSDTKERVHWSVSSFTPQYRERGQSPEQVNKPDARIKVTIDPCWFFENAWFNSSKPDPGHWSPDYRDHPEAKNGTIQETRRDELDTGLIQWWSGSAITQMHENSRPEDGGDEPNPLYMTLILEVFDAQPPEPIIHDD